MEYVVGSVAALVSGNVTPSRPKHLKRALTPTKHQPSPNVTPKSEIADRSIFLSPTLQKKKAIIKKSPKRIFENPELDVTDDNSSFISPKADKVKKHLKIELDANSSVHSSLLSPESPKDNSEMLNRTPKKNKKAQINNIEAENENTPTKSKKRKPARDTENVAGMTVESIDTDPSPTKKRKKMKLLSQNSDNLSSKNVKTLSADKPAVAQTPKKQNKQKKLVAGEATVTGQSNSPKQQAKKDNPKPQEKSIVNNVPQSPKKQKKKNKGKKNKNQSKEGNESKAVPILPVIKVEKNEDSSNDENEDEVNPNAITNQDTDSEHDSDDEVESENDEANKKALEPEESSDEEEEKVAQVKKENPEEIKREALTDDEINRTIFVGNVPFNKKCKKEIKKIFSEFGIIETVRIRTVPVKDASMTPKMAVIKSELHPDRSTVNVYVKFADAASVDKALSANNTVLNEHHLRVTRSDSTGAPHDPKCAVFVGNIPFALEDETLRAKFEKCGEIVSVRIIRDRKTNAGKGFGYVNFASKDGVELALALSEEDLTIKNRILRVKRCMLTEQKKRPPPKGFLAGTNLGGHGRFPPGQKNENTGASRRIAKRQKEEKGDGPPNKRPREINQPKEKKARKEFVGMTAEKKKKNKFDKGQKKKKAISEILTK